MTSQAGQRQRSRCRGSLGPWRSALTDDSAVFHRHARLLFTALREQLRSGDRVVLCGFEGYPNPGDSAIYLATLVLLDALGVVIEASVTWTQCSRMLPALLGRNTRVVLVGGGNLGDLYPRVHNHRLGAVSASAGHLVIQLPVSAWFRELGSAAHTAEIVAAHGDVVLFDRDQQSADRVAQAGMAPLVVPDSVTMLTADPGQLSEQAAPILWLARTDDESVVVRPRRRHGIEVLDWASADEARVARANRFPGRLPDAALRRLRIDSRSAIRLRGRNAVAAHRAVGRLRSEPALQQIGRHRVVITDRLHGHLLACLARRPNVIVESLDGKVGAYFETWSKELGLTTKASDPLEASDLAMQLL